MGLGRIEVGKRFPFEEKRTRRTENSVFDGIHDLREAAQD